MSYRHKHKRLPPRPHREQSGRRSSFSVMSLWLTIGILVGVLGAIGTYRLLTGQLSLDFLSDQKTVFKSPATKKSKPARTKKVSEAATKQASLKKESVERFEFYQLLPGMEVPIPDPDLDLNDIQALKPKVVAIAKPAPPLPPPSTASPAKLTTKIAAPQYLIQTGAYRTLLEADRAKTQLISRGFSARLQKVEAEDGIWYRVIVGPFASEAAASHQKNQLARYKVHGILILQRR